MQDNEQKRLMPKVLKYTLIIALLAILVALFLAIYQSNYEPMSDITINDKFKEAYSVSQNVRTHAIEDEFSGNGGFYAYSLYYIEESGYVQFCVRYNTNQIAKIKEQYPNLSEISFVLRDSKGNEYKPTMLDREAKFHYIYIKLEYKFEEGQYSFADDDLIVRMILKGVDYDFDSENYNDLIIHKKGEASIQYEFSKKEREQLN